MKDVIGFGALNIDYIYHVLKTDFHTLCRKLNLIPGAENIISPKEFDVVTDMLRELGRDPARVGGGSAANAVYALAKMGFNTGYIGKVGQDSDGTLLLVGLSKVDTSRVQYGSQTGRCVVLVAEESGERTILVAPGGNDELTYAEIDRAYMRQTRFLHLTSFVGNKPFEVQKRLAGEFGSQIKVSFDPGEFYSRRGLKAIQPIIHNSYIVFVTEREVNLLTGKPWYAGVRAIQRCGPEIVICKLGRAGSAVFTPDYSFEVLAEAVEVVDTTGAGDVYAAGFLAGLLLELPVATAALMASRAATQSVTGRGRDAYPNRSLLKQFGR